MGGGSKYLSAPDETLAELYALHARASSRTRPDPELEKADLDAALGRTTF